MKSLKIKKIVVTSIFIIYNNHFLNTLGLKNFLKSSDQIIITRESLRLFQQFSVLNQAIYQVLDPTINH